MGGIIMNLAAILTKREYQIAELIAWGATKKEIAAKLFIDVRTVENHVRSIYEKTGVTKANELSALWFCSRYNISVDFSPIKRCYTALFFLVILIPLEVISNQYALRSLTSSRRSECSIVRFRGRRSEENTFYFDSNFNTATI